MPVPELVAVLAWGWMMFVLFAWFTGVSRSDLEGRVAELPSGTVTFLFTDLEGSTRLWEQHPEAMKDAMARHDEILRATIAAHDGYVVKMTGDGAHGAFADAA